MNGSQLEVFLLGKLFFLLVGCHFIEGNESGREMRYAAIQGEVLEGHVISTHHVTCPTDCSFFCTSNPKCKSFNYKPKESDDGKDVCQLNNATRETSPGSYKQDSRNIYYHDESQTYTSCLDYLQAGVNRNGIYNIRALSGVFYPVFCDFTSEPRSAWTLILSMAYKNRQKAEFCTTPLTVSTSYHSSQHWEAYRSRLVRMKFLSEKSTHVRITTCYKTCGVDFQDYLRARIKDLNILTLNGRALCKEVEYINIRGNIGEDVTVPFWQHDVFLHTDSSCEACQFDDKSGSIHSENNFGAYCGDVNPKFRGSADDNSTTEIWFGGYL